MTVSALLHRLALSIEIGTVQTGNEKVDQRWNLKNLSRGLNLPKPGLN